MLGEKNGCQGATFHYQYFPLAFPRAVVKSEGTQNELLSFPFHRNSSNGFSSFFLYCCPPHIQSDDPFKKTWESPDWWWWWRTRDLDLACKTSSHGRPSQDLCWGGILSKFRRFNFLSFCWLCLRDEDFCLCKWTSWCWLWRDAKRQSRSLPFYGWIGRICWYYNNKSNQLSWLCLNIGKMFFFLFCFEDGCRTRNV